MMRHKIGIIIFLLTISAWIIGAAVLMQSDQDIVIHWDSQGQGNGYGSRWLLLLFPLLIPFADALICLCRRVDPKRANYDKFVTSIATLRIMIALLLWVCCMITSAEAWRPQSLNVSALIGFCIGVLICVFGNIMPRIRPNYSIGIRNPWTLHDETIWRKTHRIGGWIWFIGGMVLCILSLFPMNFIAFNACILSIVLAPNLYSYLLYRRSTAA